MEKRSLLAIALSGLVFILYYTFFLKTPEQNPPLQNPVQVSANTETKPVPSTSPLKTESAPQSLSSRPEQVLTFNNPLYQLEESTWGGRILSFLIKHYHESVDKNSPLVDLFAGKPENNFLIQFQNANFLLPPVLSYEVVSKSDDSLELAYAQTDLRIVEKITWDPHNYVAHIQVTLENKSDKTLESSLGMSLETNQHPLKKQSLSFLRGPQNLKYPLTYKDKGITLHSDLEKLPPSTEEKGPFEWVGIEDRYFIWALVSRSISSGSEVKYGTRDGKALFAQLSYPKEGVAPQGKLQKEFTVYMGPKEMDRLKQLGVHLEASVDYGWFSFVAHPILFLLKFFHSWVGNWGVAIILLTIFIKLLLHPINKKSLDSMKAMQKLQPKLAEIREKYKNDRERLNTEMMNLFKAHKVNPMGGCLPMLLQMPVYIALYKVLYNAIELYHAPFFWFYKDLSAPDPYFISPILLGIFMVLQQKMSPNPSQDPAQANAMLMMPIVFSVFMLFLPSGLVIYIFVNTLMTVVQQYMNQHDMGFADLVKRWRKSS